MACAGLHVAVILCAKLAIRHFHKGRDAREGASGDSVMGRATGH